MQDNILRVAAYARVSTDKDDQTNSLVSQRKYFTDYIRQRKGWKLSGVYYDEGVSGTQTKKRAGFNQMVGDALSGEFDLILTKEVCRFARNTVDALNYTRKLKEAGIGVVFTIDNIDTRDSDGELRLTIMASIAQEESRKTSERVKWGQKRRMEQGVVFGRDMLGYTVKDGILSINEEEVPVVRAIFHKYTNEGKGTHIIARELIVEGMRPKRISLWSNTVILRVLRNEKYVGDLCQKKTYTPNYLTHEKKYNRGAEEKVYIRNHHEPIIDRELWDRTQEELARRSPTVDRKTKHSNRYWCSGKIHCGECGCRFVSRTKKLVSGTYKAWRCYQAANHGLLKMDADGKEIGCNNHSVNEKALLACMKYCIGLICRNQKELQKEILSRVGEICDVEQNVFDADKVLEKIDSVEGKKRKAFDAMLEGILTREELKKQSEWYDKELERLKNLLTENKQKSGQYSRREDRISDLEKVLAEIFAFGEENEMLYREVLERIDIYGESEKGCNRLVIWLKSLSFGIYLKIKSTGKGKEYHTDILETEFVDRFP
ncbi:MAG: recombinase family protein [Lachnospiraceae bacterium]|nr:recombinase family protein [Lachnospiraceae bacterium]